MIHAITRSLVFTSGAGTSESGIAHHPALRPTERDVHERALPRHPRRERLHFLERHVEIESDTALGRTPGGVVQHAVARVDLQLTRIAQHGDGHDDLFFGVAQDFVEAGIEVQELSGVIEALHHRFERVLLGEERLLIGPDAEMTLGLDGRFAHGARWYVGSQGRRAEASTASTACSSARPLRSHWTASTATRGSAALPGHCRRSFTASFSVTTT